MVSFLINQSGDVRDVVIYIFTRGYVCCSHILKMYEQAEVSNGFAAHDELGFSFLPTDYRYIAHVFFGLLCSNQSCIHNRVIKVPEEFFPPKEVSLCICYVYNFVHTCRTVDKTLVSFLFNHFQVYVLMLLYIYPRYHMYFAHTFEDVWTSQG